jgi:hypothetical protein
MIIHTMLPYLELYTELTALDPVFVWRQLMVLRWQNVIHMRQLH